VRETVSKGAFPQRRLMAVKFTTGTVFVAFMVAFGIVFCVMLLSGIPSSDEGPIQRHGLESITQRTQRTVETTVNSQQNSGEMLEKQALLASVARDSGRVKVTAYIEMLCPDCARFVVHDLGDEHFPVGLWDIVSFDFIPWV
jgi:hypothetical protein